ncbi:hypothetical protein HQ529_00540 [Candidatus Woesearchaeota archaeon]|nr:hypothetical protein [Candidatus Woesearchaeota archaeon]
MDKLTSFLLEWMETYIKNRDVMLRNLKTIDKKANELNVKYKDKEQTFIVETFLDDFKHIIERLKEFPNSNISLVVFNSVDNLKKIVEKWDLIKEFKFFSVYFVNPFSSMDKKWIIYPHTHHRISDEDSFELGLSTMFEGVEPVTKEGMERKIK